MSLEQPLTHESNRDDHLETDAATCVRLGGISNMTLWRWRRDFSDFPRPIVINGRNYNVIGETTAWWKKRRKASS